MTASQNNLTNSSKERVWKEKIFMFAKWIYVRVDIVVRLNRSLVGPLNRSLIWPGAQQDFNRTLIGI